MMLPRFYPILDTAAIERNGGDLLSAAEALLTAGAGIVQLRHKAHFGRELYAVAQRVAELCHNAGCTFVINDRADIAMLLNAAVHVGQEDLRPQDVRRISGSNRVVGYSTHNEAQLRAAAGEPIDYVALGPIFGTVSKENPDPEVGIAELRRLKPLAQVPLVAIGGITRATATSVWSSGADSIAVVGDLYPDVRASAEEWMKLANER
jgi:thiamine-phosphate pyrophosphorylase